MKINASLDLAGSDTDRKSLSAEGRRAVRFSVALPGGARSHADPTAFPAHSLYLTFLAEFGIVGSAALGWTLWRFGRELHRRPRGASPRRRCSLGIAAGLAGVAVQGLIDTVTVVIFGLWMPAMGLALAAAEAAIPSR